MRLRLSFLIAPALLALTGCGGSASLASASAAREALLASLEAWKAGKPDGPAAAGAPAIEFVDFERKAGKALLDFSLGDEGPGQGTRTYTARLTLRGEPPAKEVKYLVMGLDPVRIFRGEDFERAMNMDNAPPPAGAARR